MFATVSHFLFLKINLVTYVLNQNHYNYDKNLRFAVEDSGHDDFFLCFSEISEPAIEEDEVGLAEQVDELDRLLLGDRHVAQDAGLLRQNKNVCSHLNRSIFHNDIHKMRNWTQVKVAFRLNDVFYRILGICKQNTTFDKSVILTNADETDSSDIKLYLSAEND